MQTEDVVFFVVPLVALGLIVVFVPTGGLAFGDRVFFGVITAVVFVGYFWLRNRSNGRRR